MASSLTLFDIVTRAQPPEPWTEGENIPWDAQDFSERMLREHLSQSHDLASRRSEIIQRHVDWLHQEILTGRSGRVLDLGCGPGLYLGRLARLGHRGVGIDFGPAAIRHAREQAAAEALDCSYRLEDLRVAELGTGFDLVMLIYGQLNVFRRAQAESLLRRAYEALAPGGRLVLEPQRLDALRAGAGPSATWTSAREGLFSDRPHLILFERFWDEPRRCCTFRWHVVDAETSRVARYALTNEAWTPEELQALLSQCGFVDSEVLPGLPGTPDDQGLYAVTAWRR